MNFLKDFPVRRQTALKSTTKTVASIRKTLEIYALARPSIRFSMKVLKTKNDKGNWTYAPKTSASVLDAATKVVGKKVVEHCHWKVWKSPPRDVQGGPSKKGSDLDENIEIEALLARPGSGKHETAIFCTIMLKFWPSDALSIAKTGYHLSVDSRPVSCTRGVTKQIVTLYKSYIRSALGLSSSDKLSEPFLYMNIVCPEGSYDANIEPAKDEVLFSNKDMVLEAVEMFFKNTYGDLQLTPKAQPASKSITPRAPIFEVLLARKEPPAEKPIPPPSTPVKTNEIHLSSRSSTVIEPSPDVHPLHRGSPNREDRVGPCPSFEEGISTNLSVTTGTTEPRSLSPNNAWRSNMYAADEDDEVGLFLAQRSSPERPQTPNPDEEEAGLCNIRISNPWSIAKVNAPVRPHHRQQSDGPLPSPVRQTDEPEGIQAGSPTTVTDQTQPSPKALPTPQQSHRESSDSITTSSSPERFPYPLAARGSRSGDYALSQRAANRERYGGGALDTWVQKSTNSYENTSSPAPDIDESHTIDPETGTTRPRDFISARSLPLGTPLNEVPTAPSRPGRQSPKKQPPTGIHKPFTSPLTNDRVWFDCAPQPSRKTKPQPTQSTLTTQGDLHFPRSSPSPSSSSSPERPTVHPGLALSLDYEKRKALAAQQHKANLLRKKQLNIDDNPPSSNSPHQNRYNKAIAALHQDTPSKQASPFEPNDPRQYWLRVQEREQVSPSHPLTAKRRKTSMLPLESVSEKWSTRDLVLPLKVPSLVILNSEIREGGKCDGYISTGEVAFGLDAVQTIDTIRAWEEEVRMMVKRKFGGKEEVVAEKGEVRVELWGVMEKHWGAHGRSESVTE